MSKHDLQKFMKKNPLKGKKNIYAMRNMEVESKKKAANKIANELCAALLWCCRLFYFNFFSFFLVPPRFD